jgi:hypothetical protein
MRLICEELSDVEFICEDSKKGKNYFIEGVFMQADVKNRNGRVYPKQILRKEAKRYEQNYIKQNRAFGELGHPEGPTVNLERVSHMIQELKEDGNNFVGRAKIMDTPYGKIVKNLIDEGARLGVSSRGMGSLKPMGRNVQQVQDDFYLATAADIVADPSAPAAFVNGVMEGKEWVWDGSVLEEHKVAIIRNQIKNASQKDLEKVKINAFETFLSSL